jgi:hypothetical protein
MTNIKDILNKLNEIEAVPVVGDGFFFEIGNLIQIETVVENFSPGEVTIIGNPSILKLLNQLEESYNNIARPAKIDEAEYQGRKVTLNKPTRGDVKKFKVYVKDPSTGNIKKVNFGDPNMSIKKHNPERRKSFRARHKCDTAKDKTSARYWSCKAW